MAKDKSDRVWLYKDVFDGFRSKQNDDGYGGVFKFGKDLLLTDSKTISLIPMDNIKNGRSLELDDLEAWPHSESSYAFLGNDGYTSIGNTKVKGLGELLIEDEMTARIFNNKRKLRQHECNQRVNNCSIAQGLLLGRNYDHCANCGSNEGKWVDNVEIYRQISMIKKKEMNKRVTEDLGVETRDSLMLQYFSLAKNTIEWVKRVLGNVEVEVSYFGEGDKGGFREVNSDEGREFLKNNTTENERKIVRLSDSNSGSRIIGIPLLEREEKRNWPCD